MLVGFFRSVKLVVKLFLTMMYVSDNYETCLLIALISILYNCSQEIWKFIHYIGKNLRKKKQNYNITFSRKVLLYTSSKWEQSYSHIATIQVSLSDNFCIVPEGTSPIAANYPCITDYYFTVEW